MIELFIELIRFEWTKDRLELAKRERMALIVQQDYSPPHRFSVSHPVLHHYLSWIALYHFWYTEKKIRMWW